MIRSSSLVVTAQISLDTSVVAVVVALGTARISLSPRTSVAHGTHVTGFFRESRGTRFIQ
jgi:hypothetical protein